ncbi:MAG: exopolysaccharide Pel transporter PelG [Solibacillus sp.]
MAGIGFELRKLYSQQGLVQNIKAYSYSTMTTVGPMILCLVLVFVQQMMMRDNNSSFLQNELFIATITYSFVFSIVVTSGLSLLVTRFISDKIYERKYEQIISAYYGSLMLIVPIAAIIAMLFLWGVNEHIGYKVVAYIYFIELIVIWMQNVFLSALKDYKRIFRGFVVAVLLSVVTSFLLFNFTSWDPVVIALLGMNIGFASSIIMSSIHFEHVFPRNAQRDHFQFLRTLKTYPRILITGLLVYSGVYIHNIVYWLFADNSTEVSGQFLLMPLYDVSVFYAYLSVLPSLIFFVVIIETDFYEKFLNYYKNIIEGGTYESIQQAKQRMQKVIVLRLGFLAEIQLLFTTLSIAMGILILPKIGFSMEQLDLFLLLSLAYFFFILMFLMLHILMYFDDQKGILAISATFVLLSAVLTYVTMFLKLDGMGMFIASFIGLSLTFLRLLYITENINYFTFCPQPLITIGSKLKLGKTLKKNSSTFTLLLLLILPLAGCVEKPVVEEVGNNVSHTIERTTNGIQFDDKRLYEKDQDDSIKTLYVTVLPNENNTGLDWYGLNRITELSSDEKLNIIVAEGKPNGAGLKKGMFGANDTKANAKISIRGNSARKHPQKSYKIKLMDSAGTWNDQRTINLNKHITDGSRVLNKLSFDLMETIPNISSIRTQFVHLYVKDTTAGSTDFEDYGLYTQMEQPNKEFLRNHLLDPNGYLYKVAFFDFNRYPDQIRAHTDEKFDKEAFESILEIKGRGEHDKLITMLEDVNNFSIPIDEVIARHFDEENILTWTASNILMDNMDTETNNFYLYSPLNLDTWLILPWDYDSGWAVGRDQDMKPYQAGISNYWGNQLLNRYFRDPKNVDKLTAKIEEIHGSYINEATVQKQLALYTPLVKQYVKRFPDNQYLPIVSSDYDQVLDSILETPKNALQRYYEDLEKPKPFSMKDEIILEEDEHVFKWDPSFDLQGEELTYNVTIARDPDMQQVIHSKKGLKTNELRIPELDEGVYYWKAMVTDVQGNTQTPFEMYKDEDTDMNHFGVLRFEVE